MKNLKKLMAVILSFALTIGLWSSAATAQIVIDDGGIDDTINVTFYDGETAIPEISTTTNKGSVITLPTYSKEGYNFEGWKVNGEGETYAEGDSYTVNSNVNFYAQLSVAESIVSVTIDGGTTQNYSTLEAARVATLAAGETPVTITLLKDATISERLIFRNPDSTSDTLARNITVDLNGFTLSKGATMNGLFFINKEATLTVKGGTLDCKTYSGYFFGGNAGKVVVESGTFKNYSSIMTSIITLTVKGGSWDAPVYDYLADGYEITKDTSSRYVVSAKAGADILSLSNEEKTLNFASVEALNTALAYFAGSYNTIKVLGDFETSSRIELPAAEEAAPVTYSLSFDDKKITYSGTYNGFMLIRAYDSVNITAEEGGGMENTGTKQYLFTYNKNPGTVTISGGSFTGVTTVASANTNLVITGGSYSFDPTAYVDTEVYQVVESSGIYTVSTIPVVDAMWTVDGASGSGTFDEAMSAVAGATSEASVKLYADCTKTGAVTTIKSGVTCTLDLNGKNLTNSYTATSATDKNARMFLVQASAVLNLTDSSSGEPGSITPNATYTGTAAIAYANKNATVNITGGKFSHGAAQGTSSNNSFSRSSGGIYAISGGYFTSKSKPIDGYLAAEYAYVSSTTYSDYAYEVKSTTADCVAEIVGGSKYESIEAAFAAATDGATIRLIADCAKTDKITTIAVDTSITLDLNGYALTNTYTNTTLSSTNHRYFSVAGTLTITDSSAAKTGSITANQEYTGTGAITYGQATGVINIDAGTFYETPNGPASNNCFTRATGAIYNVTGGWFTERACSYVAEGYYKVTVTDESKAATPVTVSNTVKTINYLKNGGAGTDIPTQTYAYVAGYTTLLNTKSLSYTKKGSTCVGWSTDPSADPDSSELIGGGEPVNFGDSSLYPGDTVDLYAIYKQVDPLMWVCIDTEDPTVGYADLASAFVESTSVTLIKNFSGRTTIEVAGDRTLNLNGYNIIANTPEDATGSAIVIKISGGALSIYNEDAGIAGYTFGGEGKVEGYAQGTGGAIDVIGSVGASVKIYGGTFTGDAPNHGTVLVCSGVGKAYIYGGTFIPANAESTVDALYANNGKIFVMAENQSDVKIQGVIAKNTSGAIGIVGGYFSELQPNATIGSYDEVNDRIIADDTLELKNVTGDDTYKYKVASNAAGVINQTTGVTYDTFEEAAAAASKGDELLLAGNVTLAGTFTYNMDLVVDLNGFAINGDSIVADNVKVSLVNASNYSSQITSSGFVYIDGTLTTGGVVTQTKTAQRIDYVGGDIKDTLGATFYGRVALKGGDSIPTLTYEDPIRGRVTMETSNLGNGVVTYNIASIYVNYIASNLKLQFMQGQEAIGDQISYSLLDYYNKCYTAGENATLDALLADTVVYAHELYLMSGKGTAFEVPAWVASAKTSNAPTAADNVQKTNVAPVDGANFKIKSATVNVTEKSTLVFTVVAKDVATNPVTLMVNGKTYVISQSSPSVGVDYAGNDTYKVRIDKISPVSYATTYTVSLKVGTTVFHEIEYSVNSYCYRMQSRTDAAGQTTAGAVALALYNFGKAAVAYTAE